MYWRTGYGSGELDSGLGSETKTAILVSGAQFPYLRSVGRRGPTQGGCNS